MNIGHLKDSWTCYKISSCRGKMLICVSTFLFDLQTNNPSQTRWFLGSQDDWGNLHGMMSLQLFLIFRSPSQVSCFFTSTIESPKFPSWNIDDFGVSFQLSVASWAANLRIISSEADLPSFLDSLVFRGSRWIKIDEPWEKWQVDNNML